MAGFGHPAPSFVGIHTVALVFGGIVTSRLKLPPPRFQDETIVP